MLSYFELSGIVSDMEAEATLSELHGFLSGQLCISIVPAERLWQEFLEPKSRDEDLIYDCYDTVKILIDEIRQQLSSEDFGFQLMIPDDDSAVEERAIALSEWCHGFLNGYGVGDQSNDSTTSDNCKEVLQLFFNRTSWGG